MADEPSHLGQSQPRPHVSIVLPTFRRADSLRVCLESIRRTVAMPHEVICVSVADDERTQQVLGDHQPRHVLNIIEPRRTGFVRAVNTGLRAARGTYVLHINDDTRLLEHSVANAIRFLQAPAHSHIGLAALFHNSPVRRNIHSQIQLDGRWFYVCHVRGLCYANFGLGRRELFEQLGYFDERYFMYGADPDFSLKVWHEAQLAVAPCPGGLIEHDEMADTRGQLERSHQAADNALLFEKWRMQDRGTCDSDDGFAHSSGSSGR